MARTQNETATSTVNVNGESAKAELTALAKKAQDLKQKLIEANNAGDGKAFDKLSKQLKSTQKEMRQLEKDSFDLKKILNNLSGSSMTDLTKAKRELDKQFNSPALQRNSKEWRQVRDDLRAVKKEISTLNAETGVGESRMSKMANGFNKYFAGVTAALAAVTGLTLGLKKFMDLRNELEDSSANLQSLTGLGDQDIEWLRQYAKELSTTTTEAGVRITASSKEIMDGFTTIGSKRPELLKNKEAMAAVTKEALTLAAAGKMDVATAFDVVTASMNQFNLGADQSKRIINAIAAGSLEGSAEADNLAGSLKNVGTVADGSNMTLEDTVAMLEVLASKQLLGEEAGTKLRGAILKMKDAGVGYVSGAFNMRDALIELNQQLDKKTTAAQKDALMQKVFGAENITAGQILLTNVEAYDKLKVAITGTNTAYTQAIIQTSTTSAKMAQARNELNESGMELVSKFNPAILKATNFTVLFVKGLIALPKWLNENKGLIFTLSIAMAAYAVAVNRARIASLAQLAVEKSKVLWTNISTAATLAQVAVTGYLTGSVRAANLATKAFFRTLMLNPYVAIGVAIAALTIGIYKLVTGYSKITQAQKSMETVQKNASARYEEESEKIRLLNLKIHSNIFSLDERRIALGELKKIIPGYNAMLNDEGKLTKDNTKAIDNYLVALEKQIRMKAAQEEWENLIRKKRKQEQSLAAANVKADNYKELVKTNPNMAASYAAAGGIVASIGKEITQTTEALKALEAEIKTTTVIATATKPNTPKEGDISADGLMVFKGGKWVKIKKPTGGGGDEKDKKTPDKEIEWQFKMNDEAIEKWLKKMEDYKKAAQDLQNMKFPVEEEIDDTDIVRYAKLREDFKLDEFSKFKSQKELEFALVQEYLDKELLTEQEAAAVRQQLRSEEFEYKTKDARATAQEIANIANNLSSALEGFQAAEEKRIETKYDKEIRAARKAGRDTTALEEQKNEELAKLRAENADKMFAVQVAGIIASTAASAIDAYASALKIPVAGLVLAPIAAGAAVAFGAAQITQANAAREAAKEGYADGGFTRPGGKYEPAGTVHAGEFVANQDAVGNNTLRRLFNVVDYAQKTNTVASITTADIANAIGINQGFSGGGFSSPVATPKQAPQQNNNEALYALVRETNAVNAALLQEVQKGIKAKTYLTGDGGINEATDTYNTIIKNVRRS